MSLLKLQRSTGDSKAVALLKAHPAWVRTHGSWNPRAICKTPKQPGRWKDLLPSVLTAHITLGREHPSVSGLFQGLPVVCF